MKTILQHIRNPWTWEQKNQAYFFCDDPECAVVYFGEDGSMIEKSGLRTAVGVKESSGHATICYCFGIDRSDAVTIPEAKAFVLEQTRGHYCACEVRNPSGRCCLKDFPKM